MIDYRLYCLDSFGKIESAEWISAADDAAALDRVRTLAKPVACELWHRDRFVGRLDPLRAKPE